MSTASKASQRPRYHHGNLPEALVSAACDLVVEAGAEALTLRAVARRVGVTHAAPYRHFRDKAALLSAVSSACLDDLVRRMRAARAGTSGTRGGLRAAGRAYLRFALDEPELFRLAFSEHSDAAAVEEEIQSAVHAARAAGARGGGTDADCAHRHGTDGDHDGHALLWAQWHGLALLASSGQIHANPRDLDDLIARGAQGVLAADFEATL